MIQALFRKVVTVAAAATTVLVLANCKDSEPEDVVEIIGAVQPCSGCRIELGPPMELRGDGTNALALPPMAIAVDGSQRFWVAELNQLTRVYDANGKFIRTIGQRGDGVNAPGVAAAYMALPGDSMLLFDFQKGTKAFVIDSQFQTVRTIQLPDYLLPASADGWPEQMLLSGTVREPGHEGWTLHVLTADAPDAKITKSFGNDKVSGEQQQTMARFQRVTRARDGGYWSTDFLRYRLSHFAKDGTLLGTIDRTPEWFPTTSLDNMGTPTVPPPPKMVAVWQAPDGLLWVYGRVAARNWKGAWPSLPPDAREVDLSALAIEKLYDSVIEVLDPITRKVVTTTTIDQFVTNVLPNGNIVTFSKDSTRTSHLSVMRVSLAR